MRIHQERYLDVGKVSEALKKFMITVLTLMTVASGATSRNEERSTSLLESVPQEPAGGVLNNVDITYGPDGTWSEAPAPEQESPRVLDNVPMSYGPPGTWSAAPDAETLERLREQRRAYYEKLEELSSDNE